MAALEIIKDLITRFDENRASYTSSTYNETQLRREFVDPFFEALGWDVPNKQGYAEAYKEVIHEDAVKIGTATKAPDYSFRVGGTRKFFVEAKKPFVNIRDDTGPAFQLRRYAWSAKLPLSILTDFEGFAVYNCRTKPVKTDKASVERILFIEYNEYEKRWNEIASIFSKEAVLKGSFDRFAETNKAKKGTSSVDDAFLAEIENWRDLLARNIAIRNETLSSRELNFTVQRTIDRLIFLRICEDRGIEDYGKLQAFLNGENIYKRLCAVFREADERYNSGLFHFREEKGREEIPDTITLKIDIDDKVLKKIIQVLYYPDSPYEFSVLPADILGQVYEQFLGKIIRLTAGHQAKVEDKPEVKKAGGVFYTPTYIVDYIVKNTVGKLLEGKTPKQASIFRILDPACGSGSFLIGAYQYLLDWHRDWYANNEPEKWLIGKSPTIYKARAGEYRLTTPERKKILLNNIYGVDIDTQAVEVTKLSLLLKVLEGENEQTIAQQLKLFHERALPDLGKNIKCGNSLIGPDFYEGVQEALAIYEDEDDERNTINPFDWEGKGGFPEIMKSGGFDVVIGNPPYVRQESLGDKFKNYAAIHYHVFAGTADLYVYFFERSRQLLKTDGLFGMICSNKFMRANYGNALRDFLTRNTQLIQIIDFGELPVFKKAATFPAVFVTGNRVVKKQKFIYAAIKRLDFKTLEEEVKTIGLNLDNRAISGGNWTLASKIEITIIDKIKKAGVPLGEYTDAHIYYGIKTGYNDAFVIDNKTRVRLIKENPRSREVIKPFVVGDDVRKYRINFRDQHLILIRKGWTNTKLKSGQKPFECLMDHYPAIAKYLLPFEAKAKQRYDQGDYWWELRACEYYDLFEQPKIMYPDIARESRLTFDINGLLCANTVYFIPVNDPYLLGVLNSKLIFAYFKRNAAVLGDADKGGRIRWFSQDVLKIPIKVIQTFPNEKSLHDKIVFLVTSMLDLNKKFPLTKTAQEKTVIQRQIDSTDQRIDELVYELYGLTQEEIKIIEGNS